MFHILRLVDAYRDLDLEAFVRTALADLHRIPLGRLGTHGSRRYDDLHSKPAYIISYHISCLAARNLSRGGEIHARKAEIRGESQKRGTGYLVTLGLSGRRQ